MSIKLSADPRIWFMDAAFLEDDAVFRENFEKLSEYRQRKTEKIKQRKSRILCAGAGLLLDEGLKLYGLREKDMRYGLNESGKPYFIDHPEIRFNLSHSDTKVMACFSRADIGCDIQKIEEVRPGIAERFFCENENAAISGRELAEDRREAFFRYWTLKESYVKALGRGLKIPFNSFEIELTEDGARLIRAEGAGTCAGLGRVGTCAGNAEDGVRPIGAGTAKNAGNAEDRCEYYFREFNIFPGFRSAVCSTEALDNVKITVL